MEPTEALLQLAQQFSDQGAYVQAAKCLQAVCSSKALPATLATARLLLGQLLLDHTHDIGQAKEHLTAAELILRSSPGNHLLRCETLDSLARCFQHLGALPQQKEAYVNGLGVCREGMLSKDREVLTRWTVYFHFKLAEYSLARDSAEGALKALQGVKALPSLTPVEQALHLLSRTFLHLHLGQYDAATCDLRDCRTLLDSLPEEAVEAMQLRVHMLVLGVCLSLAKGSLKDLELEDSKPTAVLQQLQRLLAELRGREWVYGWMPAPQVDVVVALLQASAYRSIGKMSAAAAHLATAEELVDRQLLEHQFALERTEGALNPHSVWAGKGAALLKLHVLEQQALLALMATNFAQAAQRIGTLIGVLQRFPTLMRDYVPTVHMLQGFYAQSLGEHAAGLTHFKAVLDCESATHLHPLAATTAALCELQRDTSQAGVGRAVELLEAAAPAEGAEQAPQDKAVQQLAGSLVALRQGDTVAAKVALARTLKMSHNVIGNSQLVGTVLIALAPVQLDKGDSSGAAALLDSAFTILKGIGDLPSVIASLNGMAALLQRHGDADKLARNRAYAERKTKDLKAVVEAARATPEHKLVLYWTPGRQ